MYIGEGNKLLPTFRLEYDHKNEFLALKFEFARSERKNLNSIKRSLLNGFDGNFRERVEGLLTYNDTKLQETIPIFRCLNER